VNHGGLTSFGGRIFDPPELLAFGGLVSRQVGPLYVTGFYTRDVYARNSLKGGKVWLNISFKFP
jgi:hypothetical protein